MGHAPRSSAEFGEAIQELSQRSERIGGIVDTITGIAEQTNLLALNAAGRISAETERMQSDVTEVASVAEQSAASTQQVSASTQQTSASAQQIAARAADLARTAEDLEHAVRRFKVAG
jgi:methyl-accepting chemotaxis protein